VQQGGYVLAVGTNKERQGVLYKMPRPKPPEPLRGRHVRMSDRQWMIFNQLGGADWLRKLIEKKAPMPKKYYEVFNKPEEAATPRAAPKTFEPRATDGVVAFHET
jgi:hypothetical protein